MDGNFDPFEIFNEADKLVEGTNGFTLLNDTTSNIIPDITAFAFKNSINVTSQNICEYLLAIIESVEESNINRNLVKLYIQNSRENLMALVKHGLLDKSTGGTLNKAFHVYLEGVCDKEVSNMSLVGISGKKHTLLNNMRASCELLNRKTADITSSMSADQVEQQLDHVDGELVAKHYQLNRLVSLQSRCRKVNGKLISPAYLTLNGMSKSPTDDCKVRFTQASAKSSVKFFGLINKFNFLGCMNSCVNTQSPPTNSYHIKGRRGYSRIQIPSISGNIDKVTLSGNGDGVLAVGQCGPYVTLRQVDDSLTVFSPDRYIGVDDSGNMTRVDSKLNHKSHFLII